MKLINLKKQKNIQLLRSKFLDKMICIIYLLLNLISTIVSDTGLPLVYKEHLLRTDQLCPDLQESLRVKDIDTANYPYKSVFRFADNIWQSADPCVFESKGPKKQITTVLIKAVQADYSPWNYTGAQTCSEHIKLRLPNTRIFSDVRRPLCTISKPPSSTSKNSQGPLYHPYIWQLARGKMGISFSIYENDTLNSSQDSNNEIPSPNNFLSNRLPRFVYIVFATFFGETCSLRVQQYLVDPVREHCNSSTGRFYPLCGMYDCSQEEKILTRAGFWSQSLRLQETHKLIEMFRLKQFRNSHEPSVMDFFVGLLRLLIMPMVFLVAYYVTRQLREKLASRALLNQLRAMSQAAGHRQVRVGTAAIDSPSLSRREVYEDPPPAYDTIIAPPTYSEATNPAKPSTLSNTPKDVTNSTSSLPSYSNVIGNQSCHSAGGHGHGFLRELEFSGPVLQQVTIPIISVSQNAQPLQQQTRDDILNT